MQKLYHYQLYHYRPLSRERTYDVDDTPRTAGGGVGVLSSSGAYWMVRKTAGPSSALLVAYCHTDLLAAFLAWIGRMTRAHLPAGGAEGFSLEATCRLL
eukprot:scaffold121752_cov56-Attheya_sp.AAC.5